MTIAPTAILGSGVPRFDDRLSRHLGVRGGLSVEARLEPGPFPVLAFLDPDTTGRRFLLVDALEEESGKRRFAVLRLLPLDLTAKGAEGTATLARWRQEWSDLTSLTPGTLGPAAGIQGISSEAPVLPPVFFCPAKLTLIPVVCPGCAGPGSMQGLAGDRLCPTCGSPAGAEKRPETHEPSDALSVLWRRVRGEGESGGAEGPGPDARVEPFCLGCDNRETCFPASGPSTEPSTAGEILVPLSARPWGGIVVEPFHLPLSAWCFLMLGMPWVGVRRDLLELPAVLLEEVEARFQEERRFLFSPEAAYAFGLESLLLRMETLRQVLTVLFRLSVERGHPHLGITPESIWVRLEPADALRSALWSGRVQLLDPAPAVRDGDGESQAPPARRHPLLTPPGCGEGEDWIDGTCILKGGSGAATAALTRVEFLPAAPFSRQPAKGDLVRLGVPPETQAGEMRAIVGRVEATFPEMCRIFISDPSVKAEEVRSLLTRGHASSTVRLKIIRDHSLVDDLFAVGTLWITSLLANPRDLESAARFRDEMARRLEGVRPGQVDAAIREALNEPEIAGIFAVQAGHDAIESSAASRQGVALIDSWHMARALALGLRLCGAVPGGYPCQNHEPAGVEERGRAYDTLLSMVVELGRQVRERMLSSTVRENPILGALASYVRERAGTGSTDDQSGSQTGKGRAAGKV
jgi:hypothetical protein